MVKRGCLITFEGGEGSGKSTQSRMLGKYLSSKGFKVLLTREPGGTAFGKMARDLLLSTKTKLASFTELFLFAADRMEHVEKVILPALKKGHVVICDRFIDSTVAYQIGGRRLPKDIVEYLNKVSSRGLVPDLTLLLDVDIQTGIKRAFKGGWDRFESEKKNFHLRVRSGYLKLAKTCPRRVKLVDSRRPIKEVEANILFIVDKFLAARRGK